MSGLDITDTLAPNSDQLDAVELVAPRTFVIDSVNRNSSPDQPLNVVLRDFPRVWRPGKSMRRVLAAAWGTDATTYTGRSVTLYNDPEVMFGRDKTGGTRISHMSHIEKPLSVPLMVKRGSIKSFVVQPLKVQAPATVAPDVDLEQVTDLDALTGMWRKATPERRKLIEARVAAIKAEDAAGSAAEPPTDEPEPFDGNDPWRTPDSAA